MAESMRDPNYPLPNMGPETRDAMLADMADRGEDQFTWDAERQMQADNPDLFAIVAQFAIAKGWDDHQVTAAREAMVLTHELLRRQAEAVVMEQHLQDPED